LKKSPTGPAFINDPLKNKSVITSNNERSTFIADNTMNRLVYLRWTPKTERKENFFPEARAVMLRTQPKLQSRSRHILSDEAVTQL